MNGRALSSEVTPSQLENQSLKLANELPAVYADPLIWFEKVFGHGQAAYLLALLTGLSVCHTTSTKLTILSPHLSVPLNLFTGIVGQSGMGKTPLVETVIRKPLTALETSKMPGRKLQLHSKRYLFTNATNAWLRDQFRSWPEQPLLYFKDGGLPRILILPKSSSYYGRSQTAWAKSPDLLISYNGDAVVLPSLGSYKPLMSVMATGVPSLVSRYMNSTKSCPLWPNFLWTKLSTGLGRISCDDEPNFSVHETLVELYRRASNAPAVEYMLSPEASEHFRDTCAKMKRFRVSETGMKAVYSNAPGNLARLIGNCHVVHELALGKDVPATVISLERVQQGVRLIEFFIAQVKLIRSEY